MIVNNFIDSRFDLIEIASNLYQIDIKRHPLAVVLYLNDMVKIVAINPIGAIAINPFQVYLSFSDPDFDVKINSALAEIERVFIELSLVY